MRPLCLLIVLLSLTASEIPVTAARAAAASEQNLLLFYSNDVIGETEPCG
jgi:hypothetical protein